MIKTKFFYILILQIFFVCTPSFASTDKFKDNVKKADKIKGYNISAFKYTDDENTFSANFKEGACDLFITGQFKEGLYQRIVQISSPSSTASKKCFQNFNQYIAVKSFTKDRTHLIKQQEESISEDYTFSHFQEESYGGYLKSEEGNIRFILYDCPLDGKNCENLHKEITNY